MHWIHVTSHPEVEKPGKVSDPLTKPWLFFLSNVMPVFDKLLKCFFFKHPLQQRYINFMEKLSSTWRLHSVILYFLHDVFHHISIDLTKIKFDEPSNHVPNREIFIGDDTMALICYLCDNGGISADQWSFAFVRKHLNFKSRMLSFLDPPLSQKVSLVMFDRLEEKVSIAFNKSEVKLEYQEFSTDRIMKAMTSTDKSEVEFWV